MKLILVLSCLQLFAGTPSLAADKACVPKMELLTEAPKNRPVRNAINAKLVRYANNGAYYSWKKALSVLYPTDGSPSPLNTHVADYFPEVIEAADAKVRQSMEENQKNDENYYNATLGDLYVTEKQFAPFRKEFKRLLALKRNKNGDGYAGSTEFKEFAIRHFERYKSVAELTRLISEGRTFKYIFDVELKNQFRNSGFGEMSKFDQFLYSITGSPFFVLPFKTAVVVVLGTGAVIWQSTVAGVFPQYINRATAKVQNVPLQVVGQVGNRVSAPLANMLEYYQIAWSTAPEELKTKDAKVTNLEKKVAESHLSSLVGVKDANAAESELNQKMEKLSPDFDVIREVAHDEVQHFSDLRKISVDLNTQESQFLIENQNGGRALYWTSQMVQPADMAARISNFDTNMTAHETAQAVYQQNLDKLKSEPNPSAEKIAELENKIAAHQKAMEVSMDQAAQTLALWKLNEFIYPELTKKTLDGKDREMFVKTYLYFKNSYHYDYYVKAYEKQVEITEASVHEILRMRNVTNQMVANLQAVPAKP